MGDQLSQRSPSMLAGATSVTALAAFAWLLHQLTTAKPVCSGETAAAAMSWQHSGGTVATVTLVCALAAIASCVYAAFSASGWPRKVFALLLVPLGGLVAFSLLIMYLAGKTCYT
jgi:hypothetical protein